MQYKVRIVESMSRNVIVEADSEQEAADKVYSMSAQRLEKERVVAYDTDIMFVSSEPFTDWPYRE